MFPRTEAAQITALNGPRSEAKRLQLSRHSASGVTIQHLHPSGFVASHCVIARRLFSDLRERFSAYGRGRTVRIASLFRFVAEPSARSSVEDASPIRADIMVDSAFPHSSACSRDTRRARGRAELRVRSCKAGNAGSARMQSLPRGFEAALGSYSLFPERQ